jgi:hypothetical protein
LQFRPRFTRAGFFVYGVTAPLIVSDMSQLPPIFSGAVGLVLLILAVAISIYWLLFPIMVCRRLDKIAKNLAALEKNAADLALVQRNFFSDAREAMKEKPASH